MSELLSLPQPRVLIVDNDAETTQRAAKMISRWGYTPVCAEGEGKELQENALQKARETRCQLAWVDMRLTDNFDEDDVSGLILISDLAPAAVLIVSGYGNASHANESRDKGAVSFIGKEISPLEKKEKLQNAAKKICARDRGVLISPPDMYVSIAQTLFESPNENDYHDQIADILTQIFPDASRLELEKMNRGSISSGFSTVPRPSSVVLNVREDDLQPAIVKFARSEKIKTEITNFNLYIRGRLVGSYVSELWDSKILWDIGGMKLKYVSDYVGNTQQTFANFFQTASYDEIERSLINFFEKTWASHYKNATPLVDVSLFELYCKVWGMKWYHRACEVEVPEIVRLTEMQFSPNTGETSGQKIIEWLQFIAANQGTDADPSKTSKTSLAVTHGDLHGDNLLVDESQHGWIVDFERTGPGHVLQDFVELEADLINRMSSQKDLRAFYRLCVAVAKDRSIGDVLLDDPLLADADTQKLFRTISAIHTIARRCSNISDARQYLFGLFFNAVFRATIIPKEEGSKSQLLAWIFADILFHRLTHWDEPWPPAEWNL